MPAGQAAPRKAEGDDLSDVALIKAARRYHAQIRGNHLSNTNLSKADVLQKWRIIELRWSLTRRTGHKTNEAATQVSELLMLPLLLFGG